MFGGESKRDALLGPDTLLVLEAKLSHCKHRGFGIPRNARYKPHLLWRCKGVAKGVSR